MQKLSSRVERVSNRSAQKVSPQKATLKKVMLKKMSSSKRTVQKRVSSARRTRITRASKSFGRQDNRICVGDAVSAVDQTSSMPLTESPNVLQASSILAPPDNHACVPSDIDSATPEATTAVAEDFMSMVPARSLMVCENQTYVIQEPETNIAHTSATSLKRFWKHAVTVTMNIPSVLLSLLGWRTNYAPMSQERLALQMLILNGSVRASNVEFRYSTAQEEAKNLSRSFAVLPPPSDRQRLTPLQALRTRFSRSLHMQETYGRLCSQGTQLFQRVRRELTIRSYLSRT